MARNITTKLARWWEFDCPDLFSYDDWLEWFHTLRLLKGFKDILEGVFYVMWWVIWKYRNQTLFGSSQPRMDMLFDEIVLLSFTWCSNSYIEKDIEDECEGDIKDESDEDKYSGGKAPGDDIDIYLIPLIKELKLLWKGVDAYDAFSKEKFKLRASLLWTVNDFPLNATVLDGVQRARGMSGLHKFYSFNLVKAWEKVLLYGTS
ncbi:RNA-directed DNA polymerase, eukaryota [Tanacetum coccineum]|uniref:RNA-directed DNA polymerase, eukaryota n=1 Tax=Tanacetum coccineum TaxID=301880 RepID=A0ABQ5DQR5_9ASTR